MSQIDYDKFCDFNVTVEVMFERYARKDKPDELVSPTVQMVSVVQVYANNVAAASERAAALFTRDVRVRKVERVFT